MKFLQIAALFTFVLLQLSVFAQQASIRGFVYEKETGEPVIFCNVYMKGTTYGAATDINGYFNINKVKPGLYTLVVSYLGYDSLGVTISVKGDEIISKKLFIQKSSIQLKEAEISAQKEEGRTEVRTSIVQITPKQITQIPSMGSEPDLAQYLQVLPGVVFTGDQGGQLYIRGGSPIQNKVLLDGMTIYNPFHSIGFFSVFDSDIIRNADVYTGGFGAEYGGRISSVMDITTRDGNKKRIAGKVSVNTFGSKALLEGPVWKSKEESSTSASFIFSGKTSYLEKSSKLFYSYIDTAGLPFNYTDLYGKFSLNSQNGSKVNVFGFRFTDNVNYQAISDLKWNTYGAGTNIILVPATSPVLIKANFTYSQYDISLKQPSLEAVVDKSNFSMINGFSGGLAFIYYMGKNEFSYGIEGMGTQTNYNIYNSVGRLIKDKNNTSEFAGYLKYKQTIGKLIVEPSFRLQWYLSYSKALPEPRLGIKYNITDKFRTKFGGGMYSQSLIAANSDRDVVNLFYGFLTVPEVSAALLQDSLNGEPVDNYLQKSYHLILGFEYDLTNRLHLNIEGYIKNNTQLININRNKIYASDSDKPDSTRSDFIIETGKAYGIDVWLKYEHKRIYLWAVYSLGYVTRLYGATEYVPHFDRRHSINLVATYTFGKGLNWELSARWNFGSGFPFTQTQGFYEKVPFEDGISTNYSQANGNIGIMYGDLNKGTLPSYHRLDATIKRNIQLGFNTALEVVFSITNIYNRENIFYFDRVKYERVNQLPFMPSIGLSMQF